MSKKSKRNRSASRQGAVNPRPQAVPVSAPLDSAVSPPEEAAPAAAPSGPWGVSVRDWAILGGIVFVGLVLRLLYMREVMQAPDFAVPLTDAAYKDYWARALLSGDWTPPPGIPDPEIATSPYLRPPAYPFFLAFIYLLSGGSYLAVRVVQMGFGIANIFLAFFLGRALFGRGPGLLAAGFMSVYWVMIYFEQELNSPTLIVFLLLTITLLLRRWPEALNWRRAWIPGVLFGILALDRPETLLLTPLLLGWAWWVTRGRHAPRQVYAALAVFLVGIAAMIAPVTARNTFKTGDFVLICTIGGLNLYAGNNPDATGDFPDIDFRPLFGVAKDVSHESFSHLAIALERKTGQSGIKHSDVQRHFVNAAVAHMVENPGRTLALMGRKALLFWGPSEVSSNKVIYYEKQHSRVLRYLPGFPPAAALFFLGAMMFAVRAPGGFWRALKEDSRAQTAALAVAIVLASFSVYLLFFVVGRFRAPFIPFMLVFAGYAVHQLHGFYRARDYRRLGTWGGGALALLGLFSVNFAGYTYDLPRWHFQRAGAYGVQGEVEKALQELNQAIEAGGDQPWLYSEIGFAYSVQGDLDKAVFWFERAVQADPYLADARNKYGHTLLRQGRLQEAIAQFEAALDADFTLQMARFNLGWAHEAAGEHAEAEAVYREILRQEPGHRMADFRLAHTLVAQDRIEEALAALEAAIAKNPNNAEIHNYLGFQLAQLGDIDGAIASYERALAIAPRYTLAHNNLGNALAHLGEYDAAVARFIEALLIDPDDPDAYYGYGYVLSQLGNSEGAIDRFRLAIRNNPKHAEAHNFLGYELTQIGEYGEAITHFRRALELAPEMLLARNNLGDALLAVGDVRAAREQFDLALEIDPANSFALEKLAEIDARLRQMPRDIREGERVLLF